MNLGNSKEACPQCHKTFKHIYTLNRHIKVVHMNRRPHTCECGKSFATREQYSRHMNSKHTFEKPFKCEKGCEKSFASYTARDYHHRIVHDQLKARCPVFGCDREFTSKVLLRRHMAKPHHENLMLLNVVNWIYSHYWASRFPHYFI